MTQTPHWSMAGMRPFNRRLEDGSRAAVGYRHHGHVLLDQTVRIRVQRLALGQVSRRAGLLQHFPDVLKPRPKRGVAPEPK